MGNACVLGMVELHLPIFRAYAVQRLSRYLPVSTEGSALNHDIHLNASM